MPRSYDRTALQPRPITIQRNFTSASPGSVLIKAGQTTILCTASVEVGVPPWKRKPEGEKETGWVTAEYNMLPGSTSPRKQRGRKKVDGRTTEIQRLIGRSLRAAVDFEALGAHTITIDCDVLEADGGTRTLSITGGYLALYDAVSTIGNPAEILKDSVAAVSVGVVGDEILVDLDYSEDSRAEVDMNVVMTGSGKFIEVQGTAEGETFDRAALNEILDAAEAGIGVLCEVQREELSSNE